MKNFSEFYENQIEHASAIVLSRTKGIKKEKLEECLGIIRGVNGHAPIVTTDWDELDGAVILKGIEGLSRVEKELEEMEEEHHHHHHDHDHECDDPDCDCHEHHHDHECDDPDCDCHEHHHDHECDDPDRDCHEHHHHDHECDDPDCDCHEHHHHDHECDDPDCDCHEHHHHHDHECDDPDCDCHEHHHDHECDDPDCDCHEHHHHDHGHHHADDVFTSWGIETADKYTLSFIEDCLDELMTGRFGTVLRAKGIVDGEDGQWIHFDYVPGEKSIRHGCADFTGKLCVIGTGLDKKALSELFGR